MEWKREALADRQAIAAYLEERNPAAALRLLEVAGDSLSTFPRRGRPGRLGGTRELTAVHPYIMVYEVQKEVAVILRVRHGAQDLP